ncbi:MAG: cache domain-containing protein [Nitrosopumilaceae archaeon]|nr:cache domain-containing protein [Nitrosopumilaceae archaeon]
MASRPLFLLLVFSLMAVGVSGVAYADMDNPPPAKQVAEGTAPEDVTCNGERVLMLKTNGDPICVLPSSADRLTAMEFATLVEAAPDDMEMTAPDDMEMTAPDDAAEPESALVVSMTMFSDRFAVMKEDVKTAVTESITAYESDEGALEAITAGAEAYDAESPYVFVIDYDTLTILAHGFNATLVGTTSGVLDDGGKTYDEIKAELDEDGETWVMYPFTNPATGEMQTKKSYLALHGSHIFASGFYLNDLEAEMIVAMWVTNSAAGSYDEHGTDSFGMITDAAEDYVPEDIYPFVIDIETEKVAAHGADAARVGEVSVSITESNKPLELIQAESELNGGAWVTYTFTNFETQAEEIKLSWLMIRDGYAFGAGFYPDEFQTKKINAIMSVDNALAMYAEGGQDAFAEITALSIEKEWYPFVMDSETNVEVADGSILDRTGQKIWESYQTSAAIRDSRDAFDAGEGVFGKYVFLNPETGEQQAKKTWFVMHDGYIFGAGFYLTGEYAKKTEVTWSVATTVEMYKALGMDATFAAVDAMETDYPSYPLVFDGALDIVAHGANTDLIGGYLFDLVSNPDKDADQLMEELAGDGDQTWLRYTFVNPKTGEDAEKVVLLEMHDGHIFGAGYYEEPAPSEESVSSDDEE